MIAVNYHYLQTAWDTSEITIIDEIINLHKNILFLDFALDVKHANFMGGYSVFGRFQYVGMK